VNDAVNFFFGLSNHFEISFVKWFFAFSIARLQGFVKRVLFFLRTFSGIVIKHYRLMSAGRFGGQLQNKKSVSQGASGSALVGAEAR